MIDRKCQDVLGTLGMGITWYQGMIGNSCKKLPTCNFFMLPCSANLLSVLRPPRIE